MYQCCLDAEDVAWQAADIATAAVRSLRHEVTAAATAAYAAREALPQQARADRRSHQELPDWAQPTIDVSGARMVAAARAASSA